MNRCVWGLASWGGERHSVHLRAPRRWREQGRSQPTPSKHDAASAVVDTRPSGADMTAPKATPCATKTVWTIEAIRALGATTDVQTAGAILGVGRTKAYEMARD